MCAFRQSLRFRRFTSSLQKLRAIYSAFSSRKDGIPDQSARSERSEPYSDLADEAAEFLSLYGDTRPVTTFTIAEWFNADADQANQTEFARRINACGSEIDKALSAIPPGLEKAKLGTREAFLFDPSLPLAAVLARHPEGNELADLADASDPKVAKQPEQPFAAMFLLDLSEPRLAKSEEAISYLREDAIEAATYANGTDPQRHILPISGDTGWLLHLAPRRTQLVLPLFAPMRGLVHKLVPFQSRTGYWANTSEDHDPLTFISAGIAHSLSVFGDLRSPANETAYKRVIAWLEKVQRTDGGWPIRHSDAESDILTTALAGDFLRRAGHQRSFDRAATFLIAQQHSAGLWFSGARNADAYNAIVFEVLEARLPPFPQSDHRIHLARGLFVKAEELWREEDEISDQLAVITAHHAAEMLSYSALEALNPPEDIWEANGRRTIGLRVALAKLDERLKVDSGAALRFKSQMLGLAAARDEIVHKGGTVARSAVRGHIDVARGYLSAASRNTLGYDLLG